MIDLAGWARNILGAIAALCARSRPDRAIPRRRGQSGYPAGRIDQDLEAAVEAIKGLGGGPSF